MANPALQIRDNSATISHLTQEKLTKNTLIFDGNSQSAHIIARTVLVNDPAQKVALIPKQNTAFFGIEIPQQFNREKFLLINLSGEILYGRLALECISQSLNLNRLQDKQMHH